MVQRRVVDKGMLASLAVAWIVTSLAVTLMTIGNVSPPTGPLAWFACFLTESGSAHWVAVPLLGCLLILLVDPALAWKTRRRDAARLLAILLMVLPVVAVVNERILKPLVQRPRPSHLALAKAGYIADLTAFYDMPRSERQALLAPLAEKTAAQAAATRLQIDRRVLEQWVHETASTFPSGHALNAFLAASLFWFAATTATATRRVVGLALLVWAAAVSLSRVVLGVHRPEDVIAGAALGISIAVLCQGGIMLLERRVPVSRDRSLE
jgi:phosphatidylglycerophosphatase B